MKLYEVLVDLGGYRMSVLMASPDAEMAKDEVAKQLRASAEPINDEDRIAYSWSRNDMDAREVFSLRTA